MWDWLLLPIDSQRLHDLDWLISWHARLMVLAWVILAPIAVITARFFKILPRQNWPAVMDSQLWWHMHWGIHTVVLLLSLCGVGLVVWYSGGLYLNSLHSYLGATVLLFLSLQVVSGLLRGSKGGPVATGNNSLQRGDHYDMTLRRRTFERVHKSVGYMSLAVAASAVFAGLWHVNAPRWMWLLICAWYVSIVLLYVSFQRAGWAADTYEAIWGPDPQHPGNTLPSRRWGMRRRTAESDDSDKSRSNTH